MAHSVDVTVVSCRMLKGCLESAAQQRVGIMVLCIKFRMSSAASFLSVSHTSSGSGADSLLVGADYSGWEGEGKGNVVSLAGRGGGRRDQS